MSNFPSLRCEDDKNKTVKISVEWLKEFVALPSQVAKLVLDLRSVGLGVEAVETESGEPVLDVEVTTNRPDCLNHYGVAREVATLFRADLKALDIKVRESAEPAAKHAAVEIEEPELCRRYCGRVLRGIRIGPSPAWMVKRLAAACVRSINNVTDVTNYVLMELGHPLHAFDLDKLHRKKIVVRRGHQGESFPTLDGIDRKLTSDDLVIADADRAVALAGIMGGAETGISDATQNVLLESAWFDPVTVRFTTKRHALRTEASYRFERGADIEMASQAIDRAAGLIRELAGGEVLQGILDAYPAPAPRPAISLDAQTIARTLGMLPAAEEVERILQGLGFEIKKKDQESWQVTPPPFRLDVSLPVDLVEEVARHVGYDRLPMRVRPAPPRTDSDSARKIEHRLYERLRGLGYSEIIAYPMVDPEENARFTDRPPVKLENPLSQEASVMRSSPLPGMLGALKWNLDRDRGNLQLFEMGKTYSAQGKDLPDERWVLMLGVTGDRVRQTAHSPARPATVLDLKGDIESVLEIFDVRPLEGPLEWKTDEIPRAFSPHLSARLVSRDETLAVCGELAENFKSDYKLLRHTVLLAELDWERIRARGLRQPQFRSFSRYPAVERDFSLVVPGNVSYAEITRAVYEAQVGEMKTVEPFDWMEGGGVHSVRGVPADHYGLLLRVTFQSAERTLTNEEVTGFSEKILKSLETISVRIRTG